MAQDLPQNLWPHWQTHAVLGEGGFGAVYEIRRDVFGDMERAALKVIQVPQNNGEIEFLKAEGYDDPSIDALFKERMQAIIEEYKLMSQLKGHANVVYCDDFLCIQQAGKPGWSIFIKMELLTPILKLPASHFSQSAVIRLGIDMCRALELCLDRSIIHRDIKPQNIFQARDGNYKLGDFGIAKSIDRTTIGTVAGTYSYMAPEVYSNQPYGHSADIYSLGLVLYWLLNERRAPFLPLPPSVPRRSELDLALNQRFQGKPLPPPANGSPALKQLVLKACAFAPEDRFASPGEMRQALEALTREPAQEPKRPQEEQAPPVLGRIVSYLEEVTGSSIVRHIDGNGKKLGFFLRAVMPDSQTYIKSLSGNQWNSSLSMDATIEPGLARPIIAEQGGQDGRLVFRGARAPQFQLEYDRRTILISISRAKKITVYTFQENGVPILETTTDVSGIAPITDYYGTEIFPLFATKVLAPMDENIQSLMLAFPWLCFVPLAGLDSSSRPVVTEQVPDPYPMFLTEVQTRSDSALTRSYRNAQNRELCTVVHAGGSMFARHFHDGDQHIWEAPQPDVVQILQGSSQWTATFHPGGKDHDKLVRDIFDNTGKRMAYLEFFSLQEPCQRLILRDKIITIHTSENLCRFYQDQTLLMEMTLQPNSRLLPSRPIENAAQVFQPLEPMLLALMLAFQDLCFDPTNAAFVLRQSQQKKKPPARLISEIRSCRRFSPVPVMQTHNPRFAFETCLSMVFAAQGKELYPMPIRQQLSELDTSMDAEAIVDALRDSLLSELNALSYHIKLSEKTSLEGLAFPMILVNRNHPQRPPFVVLQGFRDRMAYLVDPLSGPFTLNPEAFLEQFWKDGIYIELFSLLDDLIPASPKTQPTADFSAFQGCPAQKVYALYLSKILAFFGLNHSWSEIARGYHSFTRENFDQAARRYGLTWETKPVSREEVLWGDRIALLGLAQTEVLFDREKDGTIYLWDPQDGRMAVPQESICAIQEMQLRTFSYNPKKRGFWPFR